MLCGDLSVLQASMFDGLAFDPFALFDDGIGRTEVGVGRCDVIEALVVAAMVVVLDEGPDLSLQIAGQEVVLQQDAGSSWSGAIARSCPGSGDASGHRGHGS